MLGYRNSMKLSWFVFGLCICFVKNVKCRYDNLKVWCMYFSVHWGLYSTFVYGTSMSKYALIGIFDHFKNLTFLMGVHMLMIRLHYSDCFPCNLRYLGALLTWKGNSMCLYYLILQRKYISTRIKKDLWRMLMLFLHYRLWFWILLWNMRTLLYISGLIP